MLCWFELSGQGFCHNKRLAYFKPDGILGFALCGVLFDGSCSYALLLTEMDTPLECMDFTASGTQLRS
jgi:hypothetical protein